MKFVKLLLMIGLLGTSSVVLSQTPEEVEAENLLEILNMEKLLTDSMSQMLNVQLQQNPELVPYKGVMMEFFSKHMSYESLKPEMLKIYAGAFTASELKEINAFYSTDVGKKTIESMPTLMAQGAQIGSIRVQENIGDLEAMMAAESARLKELEEQKSE